MVARAPEISLGQKYLTTATSFDPSYNTLDLHRDLKKWTGPNITHIGSYVQLKTLPFRHF